MQSKRSRLDRFLSSQLKIPRKEIKPLLAQGLVSIDGVVIDDAQHFVEEFSKVKFKDQVLQNKTPYYLMLHKPLGVVSATKDEKHSTVIDLLDVLFKNELHIVGRLDFNSTGLILLTNDGRWSRALMNPENKISKRYKVKLEKPISQEMMQAFLNGIYFKYEDVTTKPASLKILSDCVAEVILSEGKYHQIKRMFGHFQNKVLDIHRFAIGNIVLDENLNPGQSRLLSPSEIAL